MNVYTAHHLDKMEIENEADIPSHNVHCFCRKDHHSDNVHTCYCNYCRNIQFHILKHDTMDKLYLGIVILIYKFMTSLNRFTFTFMSSVFVLNFIKCLLHKYSYTLFNVKLFFDCQIKFMNSTGTHRNCLK